MGYKIEISDDTGTVEIDANYSFSLKHEKKLNQRGKVDWVDVWIQIEGNIVDSTPGAVADQAKEYSDLVALRLKPVEVAISLDGNDKWTYSPGTCENGPAVVDFDEPVEDGNGGSKWRYALTIYAKLPGDSEVQDLYIALTVDKNIDGKVIRKIWEASATAKTYQKALSTIMQFKPSGKVRERIKETFSERTAAAVWVWEESRVSIECVVRWRGGKGHEVDLQVGSNDTPLLHRARREPFLVEVIGTVTGAEGQVKAPAPHFSESATMARQERLETNADPTLVDGEMTLEFNEVWYCTAAKVPKPNHVGHNSSKQIGPAGNPPADGAIRQ
jgi:hypothetical protein